MTLRKRFLVLFLPLLMCFGNEDVHVKIMGHESNAIQICTNQTGSVITMIICKISTERSGGGECRLLYRHGQDFVHECDSRFRLMKENQTVFLHLVNLTKEDSGNYTCECVFTGGRFKFYRNVTVEDVTEEEEAPSSAGLSISAYLITAAAVITVTGFTLGLSYWMRGCSDCSSSETFRLSVRKKSYSLRENVSDDHYRNLRQPADDFYQNINAAQQQRDIRTHAARSAQNVHLDNQEMVQCQVYENV